ncbi:MULTISPECIES: DUF1836 domain-containing protein [Clostridium]|uniref:DUF1836 domain-containing protein n=8 Tax=Clostridium TaxID=1485 RepID=A5HXW1_CLOBH|nr:MULTISPECIES: DUF1836 domain-containing protein [Clostridium]EKN41742.1 hypothetical protein CFSAN001627_11303 [Clostridium botulinum CFSAN001627]EKX78466.1 hypothetical protein CFSAN001628_018694 [Clostridium botulinum CFSAN001628]ABS32615.1 conserved hypothetical protein [Clostridium botulinum A str. ATCC 19397]ABS36612.1 conserved hypothetical protein [Clostridium botulinum A str. Hall]ABS39631.1 conserved hypothetical protein [Clostridium botulinum F str. Langeland]
MENNNLEKIEYINKLAKEISNNTIVDYEDFPKYDLFLSQVIDYLNDKFEEEDYTNNIVQNYIKNEVISKPQDGKKRGYTKLHLVQLVLLSYMRPLLTTEEIKNVFTLAFNEINDRGDDIISWENAYKIFSDIQKDSFKDFVARQHFDEDKLKDIITKLELNSDEENRITIFLIVMTLICQASAIKKLVKKIVNDYTDKLDYNE